jgi:hypothetical protein
MTKRRIAQLVALCILTPAVLWAPFLFGDAMNAAGWNMELYAWPLCLTAIMAWMGTAALWFEWMDARKADQLRGDDGE